MTVLTQALGSLVAQVERPDAEVVSGNNTEPAQAWASTEKPAPKAKEGLVTEFGIEADVHVLRALRSSKINMSPFNAAHFLPMLKPAPVPKEGKMTLVLDIDETLVHASVKPRPEVRYDTVLRFRGPAACGDIAVAYRPGMMDFLHAVAPFFEVVVFTASQSVYANQLMDTIDPTGTLVTDRLFREHCTEVNGARVKDLSLLGRPLDRMIIIDNSPVAYLFQPRNAIPIASWFDDPNDRELASLVPLLQRLSRCATVYPMLDMFNASLQTSSNRSTH